MSAPGAAIFTLDAGSDAKRHAPATLRNRDAIVDALRSELPDIGTVLEVASGSGEHIVYFAETFPGLDWQPSDYDALGLASIAAWSGEAARANMRPPVQVDASADIWPVADAAAILCINMVHIAPWAAAQGLFAGAARLLTGAAPLILYGPFIEQGLATAESNLAFDASLKARDPDWGLRDEADLDALGMAHGLIRTRRMAMSANNLLLVWRRA